MLWMISLCCRLLWRRNEVFTLVLFTCEHSLYLWSFLWGLYNLRAAALLLTLHHHIHITTPASQSTRYLAATQIKSENNTTTMKLLTSSIFTALTLLSLTLPTLANDRSKDCKEGERRCSPAKDNTVQQCKNGKWEWVETCYDVYVPSVCDVGGFCRKHFPAVPPT
jgi:hypothetical protein